MRRLVYFVAASLDGRIAAPDGSFDFFGFDEPYLRELAEDWADGLPTGLLDALGLTAPRARWDTVVMGRGTFQPAIDAGVSAPYAHLDTYVYSATLDPAAHPGVTIEAGDPVTHVRDLKERPGGDIWLCGGGRLAGTLADEVDRLVLKLNPVTAGDGISLFAGGPFSPRAWTLGETRTYPSGVVLLTYDRAT